MKTIKLKEKNKNGIKTLNKTIAWTERIKDPLIHLNNKTDEVTSENLNNNDYGIDKIKYYTNRTKDEALYGMKNTFFKSKESFKRKYQKKKLSKISNRNIKTNLNSFKKKMNDTIKNTPQNIQKAKIFAIQAKRISVRSLLFASNVFKTSIKALMVGIKALISGLNSLIVLLASGGALAGIVIVIICLIALLLSSVFGIFFSNESGSKTMQNVISEINQEVYRKVETQQYLLKADDIIFETTYSNWKDIIAVYSVKYSNDASETTEIAMYLSEKNVKNIKKIFYDFNTIRTEVRTEKKTEESVINNNFNHNSINIDAKNILYVNVDSKTIDDIMNMYNFTDKQKLQTKELISDEYDELWSNLIYGSETGDYIYWRQKNSPWSNIKIGNSGKTIGDIGCLATSIAILIEKSGVNNTINPFDPGIFVTKLNENNGFDNNGNLQYGAINKVIPNFEYAGKINLVGKTKKEKFSEIKKYQEQGYYLAIEVMGNTGQHWVAILNITGNIIKMVDPATDSTDLWSTYNWENSSQFVFFKN